MGSAGRGARALEARSVRPRGRPKDLDKRAAILRAARALFLDHGLDAVRVDQIAAGAGVSKMTVYANFADKAAIFEAVVIAESVQIAERIAGIRAEPGALDIVLERVGTELMVFLLSPEMMKLERMLGAQMSEHPDLGRRFYRAGPGRTLRAITELVDSAVARGDLDAVDTEQAAEDLVALWLGMVPTRQRFNEPDPLSKTSMKHRVAHGVEVFLKAYGFRRAR